MRKTVVIRAPLLSISGYGVHSRQVFKWLLSKDIDVLTQIVPWGSTSWYVNEDQLGGLVGEVMRRSTSFDIPRRPDVSFQVQLPNEWDPSLADVNVGISAFVETDVCNPKWITASSAMDHVVVPSRHIEETIMRTGKVSSPVHVIPESYTEVIDGDLPSVQLDLDTTFNFLMVGQLTGNSVEKDRKNTFKTLQLLCDVFKDDPSVGVILKTNSGTGTTIDRKLTCDTVRSAISTFRKGTYPRIHVLHGNMDEAEVASLYRRPDVKCLLNLTRGEGYGLPLLEAAASDLPVMATSWSGHLDFLNLGKFIPVNYNLRPVHESKIDGEIFVAGSKWAEVDESDFIRKVRKFRSSPGIPKLWASELGSKIRSKLSRKHVERIYDSRLGHLLR